MREVTTLRDVIRLLLEADAYPRIGNADWATADRMEAAALQKAETAVASPNDPPQFARCLEALQRPALSGNEREEIYDAMLTACLLTERNRHRGDHDDGAGSAEIRQARGL